MGLGPAKNFAISHQFKPMLTKNWNLLFAVFLASLLCITGCKEQQVAIDTLALKNGDILFCGTTGSDLSNAIDVVTKTSAGHNYSHMGILSVENGQSTVIHAYPGTGVTEDPLETFVSNRNAEGSDVFAYRIQGYENQKAQQAIAHARTLLGKPYNDSYIITEEEQKDYYCSQLVYEAFASDSVFQLFPMTFKDPATDSFYPTWVHYYDSLGVAIPEDEPGCNPNKMATNAQLDFIGQLPLESTTNRKNQD